MTTAKVAITVPVETLKLARKAIRRGQAKSLSALASEALETKLRADELAAVLDAMDAEFGEPGKREKAWAKQVLRKSSSTPGR